MCTSRSKPLLVGIFVIAVLLSLSGCVSPTSTPTPFPTVHPTASTTPTGAAAPTATAPPTPSPTPFPTPTFTPRPTATPTLAPTSTPLAPKTYGYEIVHSYPHDTAAFTEGLAFDDGFLYEGTGLNEQWNTQSSLRKVDLNTGHVLQSLDLPGQYFGEGIAVAGDRIVQLTWQSHVGFVYNKTTFAQLQTFSYPADITEGWGLTYDGRRLIMSDGTATLHFLDPTTFAETGSVQVTDIGAPVNRLNELEYIDGVVYANVWQTDYIVIIDSDSGRVVGKVDLTGLVNAVRSSATHVDVLNGIAYDTADKRLFVTGKWWPTLFEIKLTN